MPLSRPPPAILSSRSSELAFIPAMNPSTAFTLQAAGLISPKIKCLNDNKKECYTFQSKSDSTNRNMAMRDYKNNQVCKVKNKGEHLLDLYLTTDSKDINVQFRDMIAFKKAVEKNANGSSGNGFGKMPIQAYHQNSTGDDDDDQRSGGPFVPEGTTSSGTSGQVCWAFEFEGRIYQWTAAAGHGIHAQAGSDVLTCTTTMSAGPSARVAKLSSSHTGNSDRLVVSNGSISNVIDKTGLQILLLTSVLSLMEIMNDRCRELIDFD
ncbi:hypothetical protein BGZ82_006436 [Podila clonocystis]|nr:hypothetical protein BGZ82_006436 [Podila clonocystis]